MSAWVYNNVRRPRTANHLWKCREYPQGMQRAGGESAIEEFAGQHRAVERHGAAAAGQACKNTAQPPAAGVGVKAVVPVLRNLESRDLDRQVQDGHVDQVGAGLGQHIRYDYKQI